jgi:hypothetical protein
VKVLSSRRAQAVSAGQVPNVIGGDPPLAMILRPPRLRLFFLLLFAAGFLVIGVLMIRDGDQHGWFVAAGFRRPMG